MYLLRFPQMRHDKPLKNDARKSCCRCAVCIQTDFKLKALAVSVGAPLTLIGGAVEDARAHPSVQSSFLTGEGVRPRTNLAG